MLEAGLSMNIRDRCEFGNSRNVELGTPGGCLLINWSWA